LTLLSVFVEILIFRFSEVTDETETVDMLLNDFADTLMLGTSEVMFDSDTVAMLDKVR